MCTPLDSDPNDCPILWLLSSGVGLLDETDFEGLAWELLNAMGVLDIIESTMKPGVTVGCSRGC